jgi:hypothetical protein
LPLEVTSGRAGSRTGRGHLGGGERCGTRRAEANRISFMVWIFPEDSGWSDSARACRAFVPKGLFVPARVGGRARHTRANRVARRARDESTRQGAPEHILIVDDDGSRWGCSRATSSRVTA